MKKIIFVSISFDSKINLQVEIGTIPQIVVNILHTTFYHQIGFLKNIKSSPYNKTPFSLTGFICTFLLFPLYSTLFN